MTAPAASPMAVPMSAVDTADRLEGEEGVVGESTTLSVAVVFPACPELDRSRATESSAVSSASAIL